MILLSNIADEIEPSRYAKQISTRDSNMVNRVWALKIGDSIQWRLVKPKSPVIAALEPQSSIFWIPAQGREDSNSGLK
jgi:hypothetical protein